MIEERPKPTYRCRSIDRPVRLSGRIDDPIWELAPAAGLVDPVAGGPVRQDTEVKLLYDATTLYVAFRCTDSFVWGTFLNRDDPIFTEECVEVFLCPSGNQRYYYEINVSPRNTVFDAFVINGRTANEPEGFSKVLPDYQCAGLVTQAAIDGELSKYGARGWSAEYAIPFSSLVGQERRSPIAGDEWLMNLYRIDEAVPGKPELSAWSPPGNPDFHMPWRFGRLVFG